MSVQVSTYTLFQAFFFLLSLFLYFYAPLLQMLVGLSKFGQTKGEDCGGTDEVYRKCKHIKLVLKACHTEM